MGSLVLKSTRFLIEDPEFVKINDSEIEKVAERYAQEPMTIPSWKEPIFLEKTDDSLVDSFLLMDSINFAFTDFKTKQKFSTIYKGKEWKGAFGMSACVKRAVEEGIPILEGEFLRDISENKMREIFSGNMEIPMLKERTKNFREVGKVLCKKYDGHFHNLLRSCNGRIYNIGDGLIEKLSFELECYDDSTLYDGRTVIFNKRAQLAAACIHGRFLSEGKEAFKDIDEISAIVDYVLPKALRDMKILSYSEKLANKVDSRELIPSCSKEELEIRASSAHALDRLMNKINQRKKEKINMLHLDYKIWSENRDPTKGFPHHLTITTNY